MNPQPQTDEYDQEFKAMRREYMALRREIKAGVQTPDCREFMLRKAEFDFHIEWFLLRVEHGMEG